MGMSEKINEEYIKAYKTKDSTLLTVLRLLKTAMTNRLVELKQPGGTLDDEEILSLIMKQAKQRRDSIEQYEAANRKDLAEKEAAELQILESYLPKQLSDDELREVIAAEISRTGASTPQDMGKVIGMIMGKFKGQVDGKKVSSLVKAALSG